MYVQGDAYIEAHENVLCTSAVLEGADNLIDGCLGNVDGKTVLVVCENPDLGWYDEAVGPAVIRQLLAKGAHVDVMTVGAPQNTPSQELQMAVNQVDDVIFLSRMGDQDRFCDQSRRSGAVMSYAINAAMLGGGYGRLNHRAMLDLKAAVDDITLNSRHITVTCPAGTHMEGAPGVSKANGGEVTVSRFPMGVPQPVLAGGFSGKVRLCRFLTSTGSKVYEPAFLKLDTPVTAHISGNRITKFTGRLDTVQAVERHYDKVASEFGLDAYNVDSWHAGIHPLMAYDRHMTDDPVRWSNTAYPSPRLLHFHTCGTSPPGEICWMVLDPTIIIDGVALWEDGRLHPERFLPTKAVLNKWPELVAAFASPPFPVGVDSGG